MEEKAQDLNANQYGHFCGIAYVNRIAIISLKRVLKCRNEKGFSKNADGAKRFKC